MRNPKQLFSLPLFPLKKKREKEKEERIGRNGRSVDSIRERCHVFRSNALRFLTRLYTYWSGGKVGSKRLRPCNTPCNRIRMPFPVVLDGELAVLSELSFRTVLCALFFMFHYVPTSLLSWHRTVLWASSTRKSLPESLNVSNREAKAKKSSNNLKKSTYSGAYFFLWSV